MYKGEKVNVIMPVYNEERYLSRIITRVLSQLAFYQSACAELGSKLACGLQLNNTVNGIYIAPVPTGTCVIQIGNMYYENCI
jgi:hypothetical protein